MTRALIIGDRPGGLHVVSAAIGESSTSRQLARLIPDWRERFNAVNLHFTSDDHDEKPHTQWILEEYQPRVIVALGNVVARELWLPKSTELLSWTVWPDNTMVLKFPHPSGLNRFWNDPQRILRARETLLEAGALAARVRR